MQWSASVKSNIIRNLPVVSNMPCRSDSITLGSILWLIDDGGVQELATESCHW